MGVAGTSVGVGTLCVFSEELLLKEMIYMVPSITTSAIARMTNSKVLFDLCSFPEGSAGAGGFGAKLGAGGGVGVGSIAGCEATGGGVCV